MTQPIDSASTSTSIRHTTAGQLLLSVGVLLLGVAALVIAFQWQTHTRISVESPRVTDTPKAGFTLFHNKESSEYRPDEHQYFLLDRDSGRIWAKDSPLDRWKEVNVEGITPPSSPASGR